MSARQCRHLTLDADLKDGPFICGAAVTIADLALYPHLSAATRLGLGWSAARHPRIAEWFGLMQEVPAIAQDVLAIKQWWKARTPKGVEQDRINWGTHRVEMFLAMGFHQRFIEEIENRRVLRSVGPHRNVHTAAAA